MAADKGFDWTDPNGALDKVREETNEVVALVAARGVVARGAATGEATMPKGTRPTAARGGTDVGIVRESRGAQAKGRLEEEVGDLLFAVVNVARLAGVDPASALGRATAKFGRRFAEVERIARRRGLPMPGTGLAPLDRIWDEVKSREG